MSMVEPRITMLQPEVLAKVGYDMPPTESVAPSLPARRRSKYDRMPRELRDARRHMLYHWF
jgi:hypothetical protein